MLWKYCSEGCKAAFPLLVWISGLATATLPRGHCGDVLWSKETGALLGTQRTWPRNRMFFLDARYRKTTSQAVDPGHSPTTVQEQISEMQVTWGWGAGHPKHQASAAWCGYCDYTELPWMVDLDNGISSLPISPRPRSCRTARSPFQNHHVPAWDSQRVLRKELQTIVEAIS